MIRFLRADDMFSADDMLPDIVSRMKVTSTKMEEKLYLIDKYITWFNY